MAVSILVVRALVEAVEATGFDRAQLFELADFDPRRIDDGEGRATLSEYDALIDAALDVTGDPAFGLHMGEMLNATAHSLTGHLVAHAPTLRDAIDALLRFHRLLTDRPMLRFVEEAGVATLHYDVAPGTPRRERFRAETGMVGFFRMVRHFSRGGAPARVCFVHAAPAYRYEYDRVFDGLAVFEEPSTCIVLDRGALEGVQLHQDPELLHALWEQAERRLLRMSREVTFAQRVWLHLVEQPRGSDADLESVSRALGVGSRTLRRRLQHEGASFVDLFEQARAHRATSLLRDGARTIEETAYEMGFSDASAFHRAFKRWTGTTPSAFRRGRPSSIPPREGPR